MRKESCLDLGKAQYPRTEKASFALRLTPDIMHKNLELPISDDYVYERGNM
jgi:hypothetical protein